MAQGIHSRQMSEMEIGDRYRIIAAKNTGVERHPLGIFSAGGDTGKPMTVYGSGRENGKPGMTHEPIHFDVPLL